MNPDEFDGIFDNDAPEAEPGAVLPGDPDGARQHAGRRRPPRDPAFRSRESVPINVAHAMAEFEGSKRRKLDESGQYAKVDGFSTTENAARLVTEPGGLSTRRTPHHHGQTDSASPSPAGAAVEDDFGDQFRSLYENFSTSVRSAADPSASGPPAPPPGDSDDDSSSSGSSASAAVSVSLSGRGARRGRDDRESEVHTRIHDETKCGFCILKSGMVLPEEIRPSFDAAENLIQQTIRSPKTTWARAISVVHTLYHSNMRPILAEAVNHSDLYRRILPRMHTDQIEMHLQREADQNPDISILLNIEMIQNMITLSYARAYTARETLLDIQTRGEPIPAHITADYREITVILKMMREKHFWEEVRRKKALAAEGDPDQGSWNKRSGGSDSVFIATKYAAFKH